MTIFDSSRDSLLIAKGSHFYCHAHLAAVQVSEQSPDLQYCKSCFSFIESERKATSEDKRSRDTWERNIFNHNGKRYGVNAQCQTVVLEVVAEPIQQPQALEEGCYKLEGVDNYQGKALPLAVTDKIQVLLVQGLSTRAVAKQVGVSNVTVHRFMQRPLMAI